MIATHSRRMSRARRPKATSRRWDEQLRHEVQEDRLRLRELLAELHRRLGGGMSPRAVTLAAALDALRDQLALHFTLKMRFGYLDDAVEAAPRLCPYVERLEREQFLIFLEACELAEVAQDMARAGVAGGISLLRKRFRNLADRLEDHESAERDLIYQALCDDLGVGD